MNTALALCTKRSRSAAPQSGLVVSNPTKPEQFALTVNLRPRLRKVGAEEYFGSFMITAQTSSIQKDVYPWEGNPEYRRFDLLHLTRLALNLRQKTTAGTSEYAHGLDSHLREQKDIQLTTTLAESRVTEIRPLRIYSLVFGGTVGYR